MLLLLLVVTLFSQLVPAKADKSFDNFLKSDHTNNWAVLVRIFNETTLQDEMRRCFHDLKVEYSVYFQVCTSRFWFNYRHVANVLSIYRSVKRLGIPDRYEILFFCSNHIKFLPAQCCCNWSHMTFHGVIHELLTKRGSYRGSLAWFTNRKNRRSWITGITKISK